MRAPFPPLGAGAKIPWEATRKSKRSWAIKRRPLNERAPSDGRQAAIASLAKLRSRQGAEAPLARFTFDIDPSLRPVVVGVCGPRRSRDRRAAPAAVRDEHDHAFVDVGTPSMSE